MHLILRKGAGKKEIDSLEQWLSKDRKTGFDAQKYNGVFKIKGNALKTQKDLREEWERKFIE